MQKPFTLAQFRDPQTACAELGRQHAEGVYLREVAHIYDDFDRGYPPDWQWRRYFVKKFALGLCQRCKDRWAIAQGVWRRHDTHHIFHLGEIFAGKRVFDHRFGPGGNLEYLCDECHQLEHPDRQLIVPDFYEWYA